LLEENTWEMYENVAGHDLRILEDCYNRHPAVEKDGGFPKNAKGIGSRKQRI